MGGLVLQSSDQRGDTSLVQDGRMKRRGQTPCGMKGSSSQSWELREREGLRPCERETACQRQQRGQDLSEGW